MPFRTSMVWLVIHGLPAIGATQSNPVMISAILRIANIPIGLSNGSLLFFQCIRLAKSEGIFVPKDRVVCH